MEFWLKNTNFLFQGRYYEQLHGAAMGSPISPIVANLFMKEFKMKTFNSVFHPSKLWLSYVDDIFVIQRVEHNN